jgi:hypothetical protein
MTEAGSMILLEAGCDWANLISLVAAQLGPALFRIAAEVYCRELILSLIDKTIDRFNWQKHMLQLHATNAYIYIS